MPPAQCCRQRLRPKKVRCSCQQHKPSQRPRGGPRTVNKHRHVVEVGARRRGRVGHVHARAARRARRGRREGEFFRVGCRAVVKAGWGAAALPACCCNLLRSHSRSRRVEPCSCPHLQYRSWCSRTSPLACALVTLPALSSSAAVVSLLKLVNGSSRCARLASTAAARPGSTAARRCSRCPQSGQRPLCCHASSSMQRTAANPREGPRPGVGWAGARSRVRRQSECW
jgi:hypothetical protein